MDNILTPEEVTAVQLAVSNEMENMASVLSNPTYKLKPSARNDLELILRLLNSAHGKLAAASGKALHVAPYQPGDEKEILQG